MDCTLPSGLCMAFELSTERQVAQDDDSSVKMSHSNAKMIVKKDVYQIYNDSAQLEVGSVII